MKRFNGLRALSLLVSALLCFSLTPAWADEVSEKSFEAADQAAASSSVPIEEGSRTVEAVVPASASSEAETPNRGETVSLAEGEAGWADDSAASGDSSTAGKGSGMDEEKPDADDSASSAEAPLAEGTYLIRSMLAQDKVLDVDKGSRENAANVQLYTSNMTDAQRFRAVVDEQGYYTFVNVASGKAIDVTGGMTADGTNVQQYDQNNSDAQKWRVVALPDGSFEMESKLSRNLVLDVEGAGSTDGVNVQTYSRNGSNAQKFTFIDVAVQVPASDTVEEGVYLLQSVLDPSLALSISEQSRADGVGVCLAEGQAGTASLFIVAIGSDGYVTLRSVNSGKMLDVEDGNLTPTTRVQQWAAGADNVNQKWSFQASEDGSFTIVSAANGLALDVQGAQASAGTTVWTYTPNGTAAQSWRLVPAEPERTLPDGLYTFASVLDAGKTVDVKDGSAADGAHVQLWTRNDTPAQKFQVAWTQYDASDVAEGTEPSDVTEEIVGVRGLAAAKIAFGQAAADRSDEVGEAWAVTIRPMTAAGQLLTGWDDGTVSLEQPIADEATRQLWIPASVATGGISFENVATGQMLDVTGAGTYDGCPIGTYSPNGTAAQAFFADVAVPLSNGTYVIKSLADGRAIDVEGASRSNGANVQAWTENGSGAQAWIVENVDGGYCRLLNARSGRALDVVNGAAINGANVQQFDQNGTTAQLWRPVANADGSYTFISACGDLALDVTGGGGWDGANVQLYEQNGTAAQKFRVVPTTYVRQDFEDLLGSFTTYSQNTWNGTYNMQKALDCFNGVVLQPGESMSFYGITGRCGAAEGYLPAGVVGGIGYGGGICQASTTIYGAAIRAGFDILDRQNHSVPSVYVPIGLDAMVSWGSSDLVVRNNTEYPVKFVTCTYDNVLTCEIWGIHPEWWDYIEPVSWYTSSSSANAQRIYYKNGQAVLTEWLPSSYYW